MTLSLSIRTHSGAVEGGRAGGAKHWLGVPFARAERFALPTPAAAWSGVRAATVFGPECAQAGGSFGSKKKMKGPGVSEDCLLLNIWAPDTDEASLKPVMLWIHGGAFTSGSGSLYNGAQLAVLGDIIVVTINYRLGVLGFVNLREALELPQLPSNLGLHDQIAALEWVRDNIEAFGGDPARVTVAGESAGSLSVSMLMICQKAWPLFHGAILESGAVTLIHSREKSLKIANHYREILKLQPGNVEQLRSLDIRTLLMAQNSVQERVRGTVPAAPWYDDDLLPATMSAAILAPSADVPIIAGFNRDEIRTFEILPGPAILPMTRAQNELLLRQQLSNADAERVLGAYPDTKADTRFLATHLTFAMPTLHFAERHSSGSPTWFYRFDYAHPIIGAAHGLELTFVWSFSGPLVALMRGGFLVGKRRALAERMQHNWVHFVRHGRPQQDWPAFSRERRSTRIFNLVDQVVDDPDSARRQAWNGLDVSTNVKG